MTQADPDRFARETLRLLGPAPANWVPDRTGIDHNVVVVGGGHTGATFAFALQRAGIGKVSVIERAPDESHASIWRSRAHMQQLRTPKALTGPELSHAGLSFQVWYEARHGQDAYAALDRIPRTDWADYLSWFRAFLGIAIRYDTQLLRIEPAGDHFRLHLAVAGENRVETARKVILGTGVTGAGGAFIPEALCDLPATHLAHTGDRIDFAGLRNRVVAVIGAAASAFDAAAVALEHGAKAVHLFSRRSALAATAINKVRAYPGAYDNYDALPDAVRWHQAVRYRRSGSTAPKDSLERAIRHANFHIHLGANWPTPSLVHNQVAVKLDTEKLHFDFVIAGTGYFTDLSKRPELADFAHEALLWRDRFIPAADEQDEDLGRHPYLGAALELQEKLLGTAPFLTNIHLYNPAAFVSYGLPVGDVPSFRRGIPAVVARISRDLFLADLPLHEARITAPVAPDLDLDFYAASLWQGQPVAAE